MYNNQMNLIRKKSRLVPEEIKINPKDLKGYAMEFESIYDQFERDLENFEIQNRNVNSHTDHYENKYISRKSNINPFSFADKKNSTFSNGNKIVRKGSSYNNFNFARTSFDNDYANLKHTGIENSENITDENNYFYKSRTNSILRLLENNVETKRNTINSEKF